MLEAIGIIVVVLMLALYVYVEIWHAFSLNRKFQPFIDSLFGTHPRPRSTKQNSEKEIESEFNSSSR
jgi:hypothetical protein